MLGRLLPVAIGCAAALMISCMATDADAQIVSPPGATPGLFYNYYVPPGGCGGTGAQLYVAPRPTPPVVGHTYHTYQPLMPHEFLYKHRRTYTSRNPDGGRTRTTVTWGGSPVDFSRIGGVPKAIAPRPLLDKCNPLNW